MKNLNKQSHEILAKWFESCTRNNKISRNTVAMGIVVIDHLKKNCPVSRDDVISQGGEVNGARSGLGKILESYGIPGAYLKEITTRQGHQDGQRLFEMFAWGVNEHSHSVYNLATMGKKILVAIRCFTVKWE